MEVIDSVPATPGTVTSIGVSGGTTGLTVSGSPITTSGTITLAGTLAAANGGTGLTALGTGVATFLGTPSSANLASAVTGETGSGALVFATSPTLVTPILGVATATSINFGQDALSYYDAGVAWTPADNSGAGLSLTINEASATRIGNLVFAHADITWPATADATTMELSGLPFTAGESASGNSWCTAGGVPLFSHVPAGTQNVRICNAATAARVTNASLSGGELAINLVYQL